MKLRQVPEDFVVNEVPDFTPDPSGKHFVYEIIKRGTATLDVLEVLRKRLNLSGRDVSASGLKDKHSVATQLVSLGKPLPGGFTDATFTARFVGKSAKPLNATNVGANEFRITARSLTVYELDGLEENLASLREFGVPNYYDSQRFGGGGPGGLPGRAMVRGEWEEALRLHMAVPRRKQALRDKQLRRLLAARWGDWAAVAGEMPRCRERRCVEHLAEHPGDFAGALSLVDGKLLGLYLAAYQSLLFNRTLDALLQAAMPATDLIPSASKSGTLWFWRRLDEALLAKWAATDAPLLAGSSELAAFAPEVQEAASQALAAEGLQLEQMQVRGLKDQRLRPASRRVVLRPENLVVEGPSEDELNAGRKKLVASFRLPRGCFATIVMKRLGLRAGEPVPGEPVALEE